MKFGVRECANIVFKAKSDVKIGKTTFKKGQPVLYIDTAKTSTVEGAATTVYAQGGRGNTRLIGWEGEKTLTFTVEDALLSPLGFSILSGAGLFGKNSKAADKMVHFHTTTATTVSKEGGKFTIDLSDALAEGESICTDEGTIFVALTEDDGSIASVIDSANVTAEGNVITLTDAGVESGDPVFVDYYILKKQAGVDEMQIDAEHFAGYYYVEADTLFRRQSDGVDLPANLTFPNVKIQSNFTFTMAGTGDPSTFTFTMDAFPGYTIFDKTKKVLCVLQIANDTNEADEKGYTIMDSHDHVESTTNESEASGTPSSGSEEVVSG
jgi:hypothetical protein